MTLIEKIKEAIATKHQPEVSVIELAQEILRYYTSKDNQGLVELIKEHIEMSLFFSGIPLDIPKIKTIRQIAAPVIISQLYPAAHIADEILKSHNPDASREKVIALTIKRIGPLTPGPVRQFYTATLGYSPFDPRQDIDLGLDPRIIRKYFPKLRHEEIMQYQD